MIWRKERNRREIYTQRSNEQSYTEGYNVRKHDENETEEGKMCKYTVPLRHMAPFPTLSSTFPLPNIIIAEAEKIIGKKEETKKKREVKNDFPFLRSLKLSGTDKYTQTTTIPLHWEKRLL